MTSSPLTTWKEISEERYEEMLNVLPPLHWNRLGFLVGEASSHRTCTVSDKVRSTYAAFARVCCKFYEAKHALTGPEWQQMDAAAILSNLEPIAA